MKELEIWKFASKRLARGEHLVLLTVAESSGSSPGRQGFKMIVAKDEMRGSIGGGVMEVALVELAKGKIKKAKGKRNFEIIEQVHQKNSPNSSGMICSGKQTVIFYRLDSSHLKTVRETIIALEKRDSRTLEISETQFRVTSLSVRMRGEITPKGVTLNLTPSAEFKFERKGDSEFIYEEKLGFKNRLIIIGGGHCALALSELMSKMDFYISLFDDRGDLNTLEKNRFAHEKRIIDSYENVGDFVESGENHYIVVMTLGYKFDEIVIRQLFDKKFKYFGVLGSKAKMNTLLRTLEKEGFDKNRLGKIHTPIGLPIKSQTPEEIAISIAAQIIAVKNKSV